MSAIFSVTRDKLKRNCTLTIRDGSGVEPERHYKIANMIIDGKVFLKGKGDTIEYIQGDGGVGIRAIRILRGGECLEEFRDIHLRYFKKPSNPDCIIFEDSYTFWFCSAVYPKSNSSDDDIV